MKKNIVIVLSVVLVIGIFLVVTLLSGKNFIQDNNRQESIIKTLGFKNIMAQAIHINKNGECIITGKTSEVAPQYGGGLISSKSFVSVLDSSFNIKWAKSTPFDDIWAIPLRDGGFAVLNQDPYCIYVTKFDENGNVLWSKKYTMAPYRFLNASLATKNVFIETQDRGFAILGDGIIKLDSSGNIEWAKKYTGQGTYWPLSMTGSAITELEDGDYACALWIMDPPFSGGSGAVWGCCNDFLVIKIDSNGNLISSRWIGRTLTNEGPSAISFDKNGNFVVSGWGITPKLDTPDFTTELPIIVLDKNLNVMLLKNLIVEAGDCYYISRTADGYIGAGGGIIAFDSNLNVQWAKRSKDIGIPFVDTDGYTFVAIGNSPNFPSSENTKIQVLIIKGDVRKFDSEKFTNFEIKEEQFVPDINKIVELQTQDFTSKISVTPAKIKFESVDIE
jgi:hypothetical protein